MLLRLSRYIHLLPVGKDRVLVIDAVSHLRLIVNREVADAISHFTTPDEIPETAARAGLLWALIQEGILTERTPEEELAYVTGLLGPYHGRDPEELLDRFRRASRRGAESYFAASAALKPDDFAARKFKAELILLGDCDMQMESDFLRREAARRGIELKVAVSFPDDVRLAGEHSHDAILIGALRSRMTIAASKEPAPHAVYINEARKLLEDLRRHSDKPILIDNLPEPTVQPLGMAERGARGHRNRIRIANIALAELVENYADVHVVDIAAALGSAGAEKLLDDGLVPSAHFGSPGWMLQRTEAEKAAVHGIFPDLAPLAASLGGDPYLREAVTARAHVDAMMATLGLDRKKCVIVDLDGLLWPGVLAETGAPFAWTRDVSTPFSYIGLYFGLHDALRAIRDRGILLACVSKNDETTVRELWKFPPDCAGLRLLTPADFVAWRINWGNKVENICAIADELGFALESFLFLDDSPIERERVRQRLPEVEVWGEDLFGLRRRLLGDPRLQMPRVTAEAAARTELTKAHIGRQVARAESTSETDFVASLNVEVRVERLVPGADVARVVELFQRTTQFNTTGVKFSIQELEALRHDPAAAVFVAHVSDRFGDHGLVGAAVIRGGQIVGLVLSCRVLGLGVEHIFLQRIIAALCETCESLSGRIVETPRNIAVRNLYRDNDFVLADGCWTRSLKKTRPAR